MEKTKKIYLDNGATTQIAPEVMYEMNKYNLEIYGNASSLHSFGQEAKKALDDARIKIASKINANTNEIIFTSGGSESDNLAIKGYALANKEKGNHLITSKIEHPAVYNTMKSLEKQGFEITYIDVDKEGFLDLNQLKESITDKTLLVSIIHANNEIGTIQNLNKITEICHNKNVVFHTDAVQSFTKVEIDVKKMDIDLASFSSHKIHGPKGVGALFVKKGITLKKMIDGGSHEYNLRSGTENIPGIVGFAKATEIISNSDLKRIESLRDKLIKGLLSITKDSWLNGSKKNRLVNNVNISYNYIEGESLLLYLDNKGIAVSTGSACSSQSLEPSHVLLAIGLRAEEAHGSLRFTLSKYTTEEEINYTIVAVKEVVEKLRAMSPLVKK